MSASRCGGPSTTAGMTAALELDGAEIKKAIQHYIEAQGWQVDGAVQIEISGGGGDCRDYVAPSVRARAKVRPGAGGGYGQTCRST